MCSEGEYSLNLWSGFTIPGHVDQWRVELLKRNNRPVSERTLLLIFHGRTPNMDQSYKENASIREKIIRDFSRYSDVSVGGFVENYHLLLSKTVFCLVPRGVTPWTIHLNVAFIAGCIPVIISDNFELPFSSIVPYEKLAVFWPEEKFDGHKLYQFLKNLPSVSIRKMKNLVDEYSCWFDYYSVQPDCSPQFAVMKSLKMRVNSGIIHNTPGINQKKVNILEKTVPFPKGYAGLYLNSKTNVDSFYNRFLDNCPPLTLLKFDHFHETIQWLTDPQGSGEVPKTLIVDSVTYTSIIPYVVSRNVSLAVFLTEEDVKIETVNTYIDRRLFKSGSDPVVVITSEISELCSAILDDMTRRVERLMERG
jgi:hypothetical protein